MNSYSKEKDKAFAKQFYTGLLICLILAPFIALIVIFIALFMAYGFKEIFIQIDEWTTKPYTQIIILIVSLLALVFVKLTMQKFYKWAKS